MYRLLQNRDSNVFHWGNAPYRYTFNAKETDTECDLQDYGMRIYNPRLGKFLSVDPLTRSYPELTPYQFASNTPVQAIDLDGLEGALKMGGVGVHAKPVSKMTNATPVPPKVSSVPPALSNRKVDMPPSSLAKASNPSGNGAKTAAAAPAAVPVAITSRQVETPVAANSEPGTSNSNSPIGSSQGTNGYPSDYKPFSPFGDQPNPFVRPSVQNSSVDNAPSDPNGLRFVAETKADVTVGAQVSGNLSNTIGGEVNLLSVTLMESSVSKTNSEPAISESYEIGEAQTFKVKSGLQGHYLLGGGIVSSCEVYQNRLAVVPGSLRTEYSLSYGIGALRVTTDASGFRNVFFGASAQNSASLIFGGSVEGKAGVMYGPK